MTNRTLENVSVLCVDNYVDSLELLKLSLELHGASVCAGVSAEEAIRLFVAKRPDIIISDLALPQADGISLLKSIRSAAPGIPAIAITGISESSVRGRALEAGYDDYFVKPVDDDVLIDAVTRLAKLRSNQREPRATG